jgi:ribonuclease BN (tRNA processing enzyme)
MKIQMEHDFFPLNFEGLQSNIQCEQIKEDKFTYKGFTIESHLLNHGGLGAVLGYKIKADGKSFTFVCDHEGYDLIYSGNSEKTKKVLEKVMEGYNNFIKDSDLLIHDSQYTDEEYEQKKNWGHSTFNYVLNKALKCNIKKVGFIHYDPMYDDKKLDSIFEELNSKIKDSKLEIVGCIENQKIEL